MSGMDIWERIILPVIQFLIGPVITGWVIYKLTDKRNEKLERESEQKQLDFIKSKFMRIITLLDLFIEEDEKLIKKNRDLEEMEEGNFTSIQDERLHTDQLEDGIFDEILYDQYGVRTAIIDNREKYGNKINFTFEEVKKSPKENLPPDIRLSVLRIIDGMDIDLNKTELQQVVDTINNLS